MLLNGSISYAIREERKNRVKDTLKRKTEESAELRLVL